MELGWRNSDEGQWLHSSTGVLHFLSKLQNSPRMPLLSSEFHCEIANAGNRCDLRLQGNQPGYFLFEKHATSRFSAIFKETTKLAKHLHGEDFELKRPRLTARQMHRDNVPASSAEEYFRITLYNEFCLI